ncbi:ABC transporter substrate-binding protein [uncultured Sphingomonas sp.]|uniref:ABC transporter substrate-binding protein n=1 Tax=uncultured Sphingomonas sp. TaxID=158754 RepID=UPI0035C989F4
MGPLINRRIAIAQFGVAAALAASACGRRSQAGDGAIRIGSASGSFNLTMSALMKQQGFLESFGLHPEIIPVSDGAKIMASVISNSVDVVPISGFAQVFPAVERGAPIRIINAATLRPMLALFSSKDNVRTLKDLEGKNVGIGAVGSLIHQLTVTTLRKYGVNVAAVKFINLGSNTDVFKGVRAGTVDAGAGPASYVPDAAAYKVHLVEHGDFSEELPDFTYQAGWTSLHAIETRRDEIVRTLAAYAKLFAFLSEPSAHEPFLKARKSVFASVPDAEHEAEWVFLQKAKPFATDLILSPDRLAYMQKINMSFDAQKSILPYDRVVDASVAKDALKLLNKT